MSSAAAIPVISNKMQGSSVGGPGGTKIKIGGMTFTRPITMGKNGVRYTTDAELSTSFVGCTVSGEVIPEQQLVARFAPPPPEAPKAKVEPSQARPQTAASGAAAAVPTEKKAGVSMTGKQLNAMAPASQDDVTIVNGNIVRKTSKASGAAAASGGGGTAIGVKVSGGGTVVLGGKTTIKTSGPNAKAFDVDDQSTVEFD
jgi:hypothetical protein